MTIEPIRDHRDPLPVGIPDSTMRKRRRVVLTLPHQLCTAVAEELGGRQARFVTVLYSGFDVVERRYSTDEAVAIGHARAMVDKHTRRVLGAA